MPCEEVRGDIADAQNGSQLLDVLSKGLEGFAHTRLQIGHALLECIHLGEVELDKKRWRVVTRPRSASISSLQWLAVTGPESEAVSAARTINGHSIVLMVTYGNVRTLLT